MDATNTIKKTWTVYGAYISESEIDDFDADSSDILLRSITLAHDGFEEEVAT